MARATTPRAVHRGEATAPRGSGWGAALLFVSAASLVVLALYLAHELRDSFVLPVGPDGPVYTWWIRYADELGLQGVAGGRPGIPAAALVLGTGLWTEPVGTVMLLGPVLATVAGLAAAALLETTLGHDAWRACAGAVLAGAFAAYLAGGWLGNMGQAALFLGALAVLALAERSWRSVAGGAALLAAATLAHGVFSLVGLAILAGPIAVFLPSALRDVRAGGRLRDTVPARLGLSAVGGTAAGGLGLLAASGGPRIPGDTSQDGFFRRQGLLRLLGERYRERLAGDAARLTVPIVTGAALAAAGWLGLRSVSRAMRTTGSRYLAAVLATWAALTVVGIAVFLVTGWGPPNRLLVFGFFLPIGAAVGAGVLARRGGLQAAVAVAAVAAFVGFSMYGWYRQYPSFAPEELAQATVAGRAVAQLDPGTSLIFVVDTSEPAAAFHITRFGNVIRMGLPPERIPDARLVVGRPEDLLEGRPTLTGDPEHDRIARAYVREAGPLTDHSALLVLRLFNRQGYLEAVTLGRELAPGVVLLNPPRANTPPEEAVTVPPEEGLGAVPLVVLSVAAVALLLVVGLGWARWALPSANPWAAASLAPSMGLALTVLAGFATDRVFPGSAAPWGLPVAILLGALGYGLAVRARRSPG